MTTTIAPTSSTTTSPTSSTSPLWRVGVRAGLTAAAATTAVAGVAMAAGVDFETAPGEAIPLLGFAQLTLFFTAVGVVLARVLSRRTFVRTTVGLTALSLVPDLVLSTDAGSKLVLMLTHLVVAAIVIPALARNR
jgi:hypothetical protein